eukprot:2342618-Prymnesium_polylepis.1
MRTLIGGGGHDRVVVPEVDRRVLQREAVLVDDGGHEVTHRGPDWIEIHHPRMGVLPIGARIWLGFITR